MKSPRFAAAANQDGRDGKGLTYDDVPTRHFVQVHSTSPPDKPLPVAGQGIFPSRERCQVMSSVTYSRGVWIVMTL